MESVETQLTPIQKIKLASNFVAIIENEALKDLITGLPSGDIAYSLFSEAINKEVAKLTGDTIEQEIQNSVTELSEVTDNLRQLQNLLMEFVRNTTQTMKQPVKTPLQQPTRRGRLTATPEDEFGVTEDQMVPNIMP